MLARPRRWRAALATLVLGGLAACHAPEPPAPVYDVLVAGWVWDGGQQRALLWTNGAPQRLDDSGFAALATGIAVEGPDVYVVGGRGSATFDVAMVWENGVALPLTDGTAPAFGEAIAVSGGDVYVAGYLGIDATLWKNGVPLTLPHPGRDARSNALGVAVSGTDVYVVGWTIETIEFPDRNFSTNVAKLWKNGVGTTLSDGLSPAIAYGVAVDGSDVYVVGFVSTGGVSVATCWKNGVPFPLSDGVHPALATAVAVADGNVHVAGGVSTGTADAATSWRNGSPSTLSSSPAQAFAEAIAAADGTVYAVGNWSGSAMAWTDGLAELLPDSGQGSNALGVAVRRR